MRKASSICLKPLGNIEFLMFVLWIGFFVSSVCKAQTPPACASEEKLLTSLETQLQASIAAESGSNCDGPAKTICLEKTKTLQQQITAAQIYIKGGCVPGKAPAPLPFDLVSSAQDLNGFLLNPTWYWQKANPNQLINPSICGGRPWELACTNTITWIDNSWKCSANGLLGGHANWMVATFSGTAYWNSHSIPGTDDDYNIDLQRDDNAALTINAERAVLSGLPVLHMEFDSDETIDHFHTSWWSSFHTAVDQGTSQARAMVDGKDAIAVGLVGLDYAHSGNSELHPLLGFALHVNHTATTDTWAVFIRNRGDEGYCSSGEEDAQFASLSFLFPKPGITDATPSSAEFLYGPDSMSASDKALIHGTFAPQPGQGAVLTFTLPPPGIGARVNGVVTITWTGGTINAKEVDTLASGQQKVSGAVLGSTLVPAHPPAVASTQIATPAPSATNEAEEPERAIAEQMTPAQLAAYEKLIPPSPAVYDSGNLSLARAASVVVQPQQSGAGQISDPQRDATVAARTAALSQVLKP